MTQKERGRLIEFCARRGRSCVTISALCPKGMQDRWKLQSVFIDLEAELEAAERSKPHPLAQNPVNDSNEGGGLT